MIYFKNPKKWGFTLIETMLAMVIIGLILTPIFLLFGTITKRMDTASKQFYAILFGKQLLYEARQKQDPSAREFALQKKIEASETEIKYTLHPSVHAQSSLAPLQNLCKETVTVTWHNMGKNYSQTLISYVYKQ